MTDQARAPGDITHATLSVLFIALLVVLTFWVLSPFVFQAGSVGRILIQFLLAAVISAIGFVKGKAVRDGILGFATRLGGQQGRDTATLA